MSEQNQLVVTPKASDQLATFLGIEKGMMLETLKAQCFKGKRPDEVSDAQLAAFVSTANVLKVNPLVPGMLFAYPERNGGVTPILGPDGVFKKLDELIEIGKLTGYECDVECDKDNKPVSAMATIHRGEGQKPAKYTAYFSEWCVTSNPNWQSRPRHMIWVRAIKQCARQVIHGLPMDADEYEIAKMTNVTGTADEAPAPVVDRPAPKPRAAKGAAAVKQNAPEVVVEAEPATQTVASTPEPANTVAEATAEPQRMATAAEIIADANKKVAASGAKMAEPKAPETKKTEPIVQRALLHPDEVITVEAQVDQFKVVTGTRGGKPWPYVIADIVSPELRGQVLMTDDCLVDGKPIPAWQIERPVRITVRGKKFGVGLKNSVEKIEVIDGGAAETQAEEDV